VISANDNLSTRDASTNRKRWVLAIIIATGLLVTLWLFREISLKEIDKFRRGFEGNAAIRSYLVESQLNNDLLTVETLVRLFQASELVEPHEFRAFTQPMLARAPEMSAIAWVPAVSKEELSSFQESASGVLRRQFRLFERGSDRNPVTPGDRRVYYPIFYIESTHPGYREDIGFDMGAVPKVLAGFEKTVRTGKTTICSKTDVMMNGRPAVVIIVPCHRKDFRHETGGMKAWAIQGFAVAVLQEDSLKASLLESMGTEDVVFALHDVSNPADAKPIVLGSSGHYTEDSWRSPFLPSPPRLARSFAFADRTLRLEIVAGHAYMVRNYPLTFWLILPAGFMLTLMLCLYISSMLSQSEVLERTVAERTEELQLSEEKYRLLVENAGEAIFVVQDGAFRFVNARCCEVLGYDRDEILNSNMERYLHPEDRAMVVERHAGMLRGEDLPRSYSFRVLNRAGNVLWVEINAVLIPWEGRNAALSFLTDITERKQAAEALREREERLQSIFENAEEIIHMISWDGTFLHISPSWERSTGFPVAETVGKSFVPYVHPDDAPACLEVVKKVYETGRPHKILEFRVRHASGKWIWFMNSGVAVKDAQGKPLYFMGVAVDITERKQAEEALRRSEELYSRLVTTIPDFIIQTSDDGTIVFMNDRALELSGYTREELAGSNILTFIAPEDRDRAIKNNLLRQNSMVGTQEYDLIMKDGRRISFEVNGDTLRNADGTPSGTVFLCRDITQRKLAEQEKAQFQARLIQAQKMESIGTLAGGIAHDFNNILSSVLGYAELARMKNEKGDPIEDDINQVIKAGIRARDLVKQILAFSRQSEIKKDAITVAPIVKEAIKLLRASLPSTIEIRLNVTALEATVMADPTQMHQIVMNLSTNAAHAMKDKGGVLTVDLNEVGLDMHSVQHYPGLEPGRYLRMSVSDTGTGIPGDIIGKIFDPFFTTKERGEGTGMGLSVVHGIIKEMGGAITVYSEPGTGTTFHILLPLVAGRAARAEDKGTALKRGSGRILFVDDETGILESGRKILERLGYSVAVFTSPVQALEEFRKDPGAFDLVLTDLTMPKMTGLELSGLVHETRPDIPIVLCTGFGSLIPEERMRQVGIHAMVIKPMIVSELTDVVFNALDLDKP
jgi:PAS domain S-box-containing protein